MRAHPDIDIKLETVQWDNLQQRLTTDIAGGTAPTSRSSARAGWSTIVKNDIAEPLDSYMTPEFKGRFIETFLPPVDHRRQALRPAGGGLGARHVLQQGRCSQKAGVAEPPKTWDELEADAKKVKAPGGDTYGFGLAGQGDRDRRLLVLRAVGHGGETAQGRQVRHRQPTPAIKAADDVQDA